ncbi:hypothetical protein [Acrocarpospora macrocephala]|nr:hypothetical protein [Acrocarpospora macrocephala]
MSPKKIPAVIAAAVLSATGCTSSAAQEPDPAATATAAAQVRPGPENCPVTLPAKGPSSIPEEALFGWERSHGDGTLAVGGLWPKGVIEAGPDFVEQDGSIRMKFGWWRGVPGKLGITGRRLDGPAPNLRADVPVGYEPTGFQASGLYFPTEGCWEVTGRLGTTSLVFVTYVTKTAASTG